MKTCRSNLESVLLGIFNNHHHRLLRKKQHRTNKKMQTHKNSHKNNKTIVVVNAKPARAVALLLGDHDSSHTSTDPPGGFHCPSGPDRSISLVVGLDDVSTGRWVVDQGTGRRGSEKNNGSKKNDEKHDYNDEHWSN